ncbi:hypothetical protein GE09DRAFT_1227424 [Coniochaeta sp. 2T2.1]|nr:hypothetical protein GE09DRAFT_1227424 [Coniochaeta sp. 2T2.1]
MSTSDSSSTMIGRADVVELFEKQTAAFEQRLTAQAQEFETKLAEVNNRYFDAFVTTNKSLQRSAAQIIEVNDDIQTSVASIKAQIANSTVEFGRVLDLLATRNGNQGSVTPPGVLLQQLYVQHDNMRVLITELENQLKETTVRHVTEGSMACNCSHKTITTSSASRASGSLVYLERRLAKLHRGFVIWKEGQQGTTSHDMRDDAEEDDIAVDDLRPEANDGVSP